MESWCPSSAAPRAYALLNDGALIRLSSEDLAGRLDRSGAGSDDMDRARRNQARHCPVCGGSRWWRSRTGRSICARCHPDAMEALQVLSDQTRSQCRLPDSSPRSDRGDSAGAGSAGRPGSFFCRGDGAS